MTTSPRILKRAALSAGAVVIFAAPVYCQVPQKIAPAAQMLMRSSAPLSVTKRALQVPLAGCGALHAGVYTYVPAANVSVPPVPALEPMPAARVSHAQELLRKTLSKPANDLYGLFKQAVYAHQNSRAVAKGMNRDYFDEVNALLQNAVQVEQTLGYAALRDYLRAHGGQMPALSNAGPNNGAEEAAQTLTFYASEELGVLLNKMLARSAAKREPTPDEWLAVNVLSVMMPKQTRPLFYELLVTKQYRALLAVSLDPYLKNAAMQKLRNGTLPAGEIVPASTAQRVAERENRLERLTQESRRLPAIITHQQQQYAKKQIIYNILKSEGQTAQTALAEKTKAQSVLLRSQRRLKAVSAQIARLNAELDFLRTK